MSTADPDPTDNNITGLEPGGGVPPGEGRNFESGPAEGDSDRLTTPLEEIEDSPVRTKNS